MSNSLKGKYNRLSNDKSQLQQFGDAVCESLDDGSGEMIGSIPNLIKNTIKADKDIISKIKLSYDEEDNTVSLIFPKGVMPVSWFDRAISKFVYCDYGDNQLIDDSGTDYGSVNIYDDTVEIDIRNIGNNYTKADISSLLTVNFQNTDDSTDYPNWCAVLNPSLGTKLYLHKFQDNNGVPISVITDSSDPFVYTSQSGPGRVASNGNIISLYGSNVIFIGTYFSAKSFNSYGIISEGALVLNTISSLSIADTVTEL